MTRKEVVGVRDCHEGVLASFGTEKVQERPAMCNNCDTYSEHSQELTSGGVNIPEASPLSTDEKSEPSTASRDQQRRGSRARVARAQKIVGVALRAAILLAFIWFVKIWLHGAVPTLAYEEYAVDFSKQLLVEGEPHPSTIPPPAVPRGRLYLVLHLGLGDQSGLYNVVLTREGATYSAASGTAKLENGRPVLRVKLDLTQAPAGHYLLGIRPTGWEWRYYKVTLKSAHWVS